MNTNLLNIFLELVQIDSPSGKEGEMAEYVKAYLNSLVDEVKKDIHGNIFARTKGEGEPLFFISHMDTVEPGCGVTAQIKNGYVTSDGTTILGADNKAAVACILEALCFFKSSKIKHRPIELIFTYSEEVGNYGAINFDYSWLQAKIGYCFDSISPVGTIIQASPYYERFDIKILGKAAHASCPHEANNILHFLTSLLNEITLGKLDDDSLMNIGVVHGGDVRNTIPGELVIKGEIRSFVESKLIQHKKYFLQKIHKLISKHKMKIELEFVRENPGYKYTSSRDISIIKTIKQLIKKNGFAPKMKTDWGVSDANIVNEKGLLCFNLGDGVEGAHTKQERVKISSLNDNLKLIKALACEP